MSDHVSKTIADQPACEHDIHPPVICPQCDPAAYRRARPQVERYLRRCAEEGRPVRTE